MLAQRLVVRSDGATIRIIDQSPISNTKHLRTGLNHDLGEIADQIYQLKVLDRVLIYDIVPIRIEFIIA